MLTCALAWNMLQIIFYKTITGECPVEEFLDGLTSDGLVKSINRYKNNINT